MITDNFKPGDRVSVEVEWPNGKVTRVTGKLIVIRGKRDDAYVEADIGCVVGPAETLEREGEESDA